jgi:uncharacterized protein DUF1116
MRRPPRTSTESAGPTMGRGESAVSETTDTDGKVERANKEAVDRFMAAEPVMVDICPAREVIPRMSARTILHSGPPVTWGDMAETQKGAVIGAAIFEGLATTIEEGRSLGDRGDFELGAAHDHDAVGPGTGAIAPSMAVVVVENRTHGNRAYCPLQDIQFAFGANDPETLRRLHWLSDVLAPALKDWAVNAGGVELAPVMQVGLHMGDEGHDRLMASSALFTRMFGPYAVRSQMEKKRLREIFDYLATDIMADWIFESPWMAACKASLTAAHGIDHATFVTTMAGNGATFGIRVSGLGDDWFIDRAPKLDGVFFEGYTVDDGQEEMGDSVINDTAGFGAAAFACSPVYMPFVGKRSKDSIDITRRMHDITIAKHTRFTIPSLDFEGIPAGFDLAKIIQSGTVPTLAAGIGHRTPGIGFIGLGVGEAPRECFVQAWKAYQARYSS